MYLTLTEKLNLISKSENGAKYAQIARDLDMPQSSVRTICDKRDIYKAQAAVANPSNKNKIVMKRSFCMEKMEKLLALWILDLDQRGIPVCTSVIQTKAVSLFDHIKANHSDMSETEIKKGFIGSNGWFERFKKRQEIKNVKLVGESKSADHEAAEKYPSELEEIIRKGNYCDEQIFNGFIYNFFLSSSKLFGIQFKHVRGTTPSLASWLAMT